MTRWRGWLDATVGTTVVAALRDATGRPDVLPVVRSTRPAALGASRRVAFWSLTAGVGTSTIAALVAHRSAAGGAPPVLLDLDRWVPALGLRAGIAGATLADALLRPGREHELLSRWGAVSFLPGSASLGGAFDPPRIAELLGRLASARPLVADLGAGADALAGDVVETFDRICLCVGTRAAHLQAAFAAAALLRARTDVVLVVVNAVPDDAARIAARLPWPLAAAIPPDPHLARDEFGARTPTLRAIDAVLRAVA